MGVYGPGDTRFLKLFRSISRRRFLMIGSGEIFYQITYIDDMCRGIMLCCEHPAASGEAFILAGDHHTTLNELVETIGEAVGARPLPFKVPMAPVKVAVHVGEAVCRPLRINPPLYPRRVEFFSKAQAADISKARSLLGYRPQVGIEDGVRRTAEWYREQGWK